MVTGYLPLSINRQTNQPDYACAPKQDGNKSKDGFFAPKRAKQNNNDPSKTAQQKRCQTPPYRAFSHCQPSLISAQPSRERKHQAHKRNHHHDAVPTIVMIDVMPKVAPANRHTGFSDDRPVVAQGLSLLSDFLCASYFHVCSGYEKALRFRRRPENLWPSFRPVTDYRLLAKDRN